MPVLLLNVFPTHCFFSVGVWVLLKGVCYKCSTWTHGFAFFEEECFLDNSCGFHSCRCSVVIVFPKCRTEPSMNNETTTIGLCIDTPVRTLPAFMRNMSWTKYPLGCPGFGFHRCAVRTRELHDGICTNLYIIFLLLSGLGLPSAWRH